MMKRRVSVYLACAALYALPLFAQQDGNAPNVAAPAIALYRDHPPAYVPGETVAITLTITGQGMEGVRALGLEEQIPEGWTLVSVREYAGDPPQVQPVPGMEPPFEFAWITPPALPCVFTYTVQVPGNAWGQQQLYGILEYRLDLGAEQMPPTVTEIMGPEPQPPRLTLMGDNPTELRQDTPWSEPGYTALDQNDKDISAYVSVAGTVNTASTGTYTLEYKVTSPDTGLTATAARTVQVVTAPASEPAATPQPPRGSQSYRGTSTAPGIAAGVTGVPQPRPSPTGPPGISAPEDLPVELPDLSAYRPVSMEQAAEGEATVPRESTGRVKGEREKAGTEALESAPDRESSVSRERGPYETATPERTARRSLDTTGNTPIDRPPAAPTRRGIYGYWPAAVALLIVGATLAALVWRMIYRPSKKGNLTGKGRG